MENLREELFHVVVPVAPEPKRRPRATTMMTSGGPRARVYQSKKDRDWERAMYNALIDSMPVEPWSGGITMRADFYLSRPKRLCRKKDPPHPLPHTTKPDLSNLVKSLEDVLSKIGFMDDDKLIHSVTARKFYAEIGGRPRVEIWLIQDRML